MIKPDDIAPIIQGYKGYDSSAAASMAAEICAEVARIMGPGVPVWEDRCVPCWIPGPPPGRARTGVVFLIALLPPRKTDA